MKSPLLKNVLATLFVAAGVVSAQSPQNNSVGEVSDERNPLHFPVQNIQFQELVNGSIVVADENTTRWFADYNEYFRSPFFQRNDLRCGANRIPTIPGNEYRVQGDCGNNSTTISSQYNAAGGQLYRIPVVVHVLTNNRGQGDLSDALIQSQIDILNEDFLALAGSPGGAGTDSQIEFYLAGTTRTRNNTWFRDSGNYYDTLSWDTNQYLNIYTNQASGNLGYAYPPAQGGIVGSSFDRIVILYSAFGRNSSYGPPYNQGRTTTHEVGHYLGLAHTFAGGCATESAPGCYTTGDLICDTNSESTPNYSSCGRVTCGSSDPVTNYMDYSNDTCMTNFTFEQVNRMRCTLDNWRVNLADSGTNPLPGSAAGPNPNDGASNVSTGTSLSWSAGSNTDSHDVYFGTSSSPAFQGNQAGTTFDPGTLAFSTTYYWRVDEVNANGTTSGSTWSFTTAPMGGGGTDIVLTAAGVFKGKKRTNLSWTQGISGPVEIYRNGVVIASGTGTSFTDQLGRQFSGTVTYMVCYSGTSTCSNSETIDF